MEKSILLVSSHQCPPCKTYTPLLEKFCTENSVNLKIIYVEDDPATACKCQAMSTPTTLFIDSEDPTEVEKSYAREIGIVKPDTLRKILFPS